MRYGCPRPPRALPVSDAVVGGIVKITTKDYGCTMKRFEKSENGQLITLLAFFGLTPLALFVACDIFVHGFLSVLPTAAQKVYYLVIVTLLAGMSVTSLLAGLETLRDQVRQPFRWATGGLLLAVLLASFLHPSGPGP